MLPVICSANFSPDILRLEPDNHLQFVTLMPKYDIRELYKVFGVKKTQGIVELPMAPSIIDATHNHRGKTITLFELLIHY